MSDTEVIQPDQVTTSDDTPEPGTDLVPAEARTPTAVEAAAEAALAMPGAAGHDEFWALAAQARILSMSGAAPKLVRENPHLALHLAMVGRDLGISPSAALELIDVIETRGQPRLSLSPQLLNGQIRRLGLGEIVPVERSAAKCVAAAVGPGGTDRRCRVTGQLVHVPDCGCDVLGYSEFTWEDARTAGLVGPECQPSADGRPAQHPKTQTRGGSQGRNSYKVCGCNEGYITYPKRMLWWRASGFAADDYFPEAGLGLYTAEELGAVVDGEGRPIDVASVELPPGYDRAELPRGNGGGSSAPTTEPMVDADELQALQERLYALPDGALAEARNAWKSNERLAAHARPHSMPRRLLGNAKALVNAHWGKARASGVDMDAELDALRHQLADTVIEAGRLMFVGCTSVPGASPQQAPQAPEAAPVPDSADDTQTDAEGPQGPADGEPDWRYVMRMTADLVKQLGQGVPPEAIEAIVNQVKGMHHTAINTELADAGYADAYPPESPIDLRRMRVCGLRLEAFRTTGELPDGA